MMERGHARWKLPPDPVLVRLLSSSHHQTRSSNTIIDDARGFRKSYPQLLGDILQTAFVLRTSLPAFMFDEQGLLTDCFPYIGILVRSGYEYIVAFFAVRAVGGACMPIASGILPEEAAYLVSKSQARCLLAGKGCEVKAAEASASAEARGESICWLPVCSRSKPKDRNITVEIDHALPLDPRRPGLLLWTSGTTGPPKGVVLPRTCPSTPDEFRIPDGVAVSYRACHWIGGSNSLIRPILAGNKLHILRDASAQGLLHAMLRHRFTHAVFTPGLLRQMKELLLSSGVKPEEFRGAFQGLPAIMSSSAPIEPSLREFWTSLTGVPFENIYACTETGGVISRAVSRPNGSIGTPLPGCEVKLAEGDQGEILVKTPAMFTKYLGDEEKTKAALDEDGFFKTGDLAELKDGDCIFAGRASTDYISFHYFRIPALVVETSLMDLPYVADACVLGVPYHEARQLCGAVIQLRRGCRDINLARIRADLAGVVAAYMLPVVLRILREGEQMPRTVSGKPMKSRILSEFLGTTKWFPAEDLPKDVEYWGCVPVIDETTRPWDWGGMQCAR